MIDLCVELILTLLEFFLKIICIALTAVVFYCAFKFMLNWFEPHFSHNINKQQNEISNNS